MKELLDAIADKEQELAIFYFEFMTINEINALRDASGNPLYHLAIENDLPELFDAIKNTGADLKVVNKLNETPLDFASRLSKTSFINKLSLSASKPIQSAQEIKVRSEDRDSEKETTIHSAGSVGSSMRVESAGSAGGVGSSGCAESAGSAGSDKASKFWDAATETKVQKEGAGALVFSSFGRGSSTLSLDADPTAQINREFKELNEFIHIAECDCCPQLTRKTSEKGLRDEVDSITCEVMQKEYPASKHNTIVMLALGAGELKQVLTTTAHLMHSGYNVELVLVDHNYKYLSSAYKKYFSNKSYPFYRQGKDEEGRVYPKPDVSMTLDDYEQVLVASGNSLDKTFFQFEKMLQKLQTLYKRKASVIGRFTSLEVYKSILSDGKAPIIRRYGEPSRYDRDVAQMGAYGEEFELYKKTCHGKTPQLVTLIDDITELQDAHGPITDPTQRDPKEEWLKLRDYRATVYEFDIVREMCRVSKQCSSKSSLDDNIVFIATSKINNPAVTLSAMSVNINDHSKRDVRLKKLFEHPDASKSRGFYCG